MRKPCYHGFTIVEEFNDLGVQVTCLLCGSGFQIWQDLLETDWLPFNYTSSKGKDFDLVLLARKEVLPNE